MTTGQSSPPQQPELEPALRQRLAAVCSEGWELWERFDLEVRGREFHSFVAADYDLVLKALIEHRAPGKRFLELGSATGVITILADLLGFEAYGIELDSSLVATARSLAGRFDSKARFVAGSFLPSGYRWEPGLSVWTEESIGLGRSGYLELGLALDDFDVIFGYPWGGEAEMMQDLVRKYGRRGALLLLNDVNDGVRPVHPSGHRR